MNKTIESIEIHINANKQHDMEPDLKGSFELGDQPLDVAIWTQRTKDRTRIYQSMNISEPYVKGEKTRFLVKAIKLYEIDGTGADAPDYQSPKSFILFDQTYWAALWTVTGQEGDDLMFRMELLRKPFSVKLTQVAAEAQQDLKERTLERRRERDLREAQAARDAESLHEDIDMTPEPE